MRRGGIFGFLVIIAFLSLLLDWYVYTGLKTITSDWKSQAARLVVNLTFPLLSLAVTIIFLISFSTFRSTKGFSHFNEWMLSLFLTFLVTKIIFSLILLLGDVGRLFAGAYSLATDNHAVKHIPSRRKFISELAIFIAAFPFFGFIYAIVRGKYDYKVHRQTLYYDNLPDAFDGFTITQLSDIHSGSFDNETAMQRGIDLAQAQKSDLFVFTGDLVNNLAEEIEQYIDNFSQLRSPYGQFSILGNHDYGDYIQWDSPEKKAANLEKLKGHHRDLGFRLMLDENIDIEKDGQKISLIGIQNWGRGFVQVGDLNKALNGVDKDAFKILLSHDPTHWEEQVRYHPTNIDLTLSGHTHGAQFGVEVAGLRWSPVQYRYLDWAGLINEKNRYLYVNRGFGFLAFSGRLGIWPEVTVITLKKKRA